MFLEVCDVMPHEEGFKIVTLFF